MVPACLRKLLLLLLRGVCALKLLLVLLVCFVALPSLLLALLQRRPYGISRVGGCVAAFSSSRGSGSSFNVRLLHIPGLLWLQVGQTVWLSHRWAERPPCDGSAAARWVHLHLHCCAELTRSH